jgi:stearoyl-CoA desaturase (delta-9 desaturase)
MQLFLAVLAMSSMQKGVLWWASHHRLHHMKSDQPGDVHSVRHDGFFWSHIGWILSDEHEATDLDRVRDLAKFPELRFLNRFHLIPSFALALVLFLVGGWSALYWGACFSTVICWHGTFTINSLAHVFGKRRYATTDDSKNNWWLALLTMGEGWHNNHHHYQRSTAQGWYWWEIDMTYYILRAFAAVGLVSDLRPVPDHIRDAHEAKLPASTPSPATTAIVAAPTA